MLKQTDSFKPLKSQIRYLPIAACTFTSPFWRYRCQDTFNRRIEFHHLRRVPALDRRSGKTYRAAHKDIIPPGLHIPDPDNFGRLNIPAALIKRLQLTVDDPEAWAVGYDNSALILIFFPCWADARGNNLRAMFSKEICRRESSFIKETANHAISYCCPKNAPDITTSSASSDFQINYHVTKGLIDLELKRVYLWPCMVKTQEERHEIYWDRLYLEIPEPFTTMQPIDWHWLKNSDDSVDVDRPLFDLWYDELANLFLIRRSYRR